MLVFSGQPRVSSTYLQSASTPCPRHPRTTRPTGPLPGGCAVSRELSPLHSAAPPPRTRSPSPPPPRCPRGTTPRPASNGTGTLATWGQVLWSQTTPLTAGANWGEWFTPGFEINVGPRASGTLALTYEIGSAGSISGVGFMSRAGHLRVMLRSARRGGCVFFLRADPGLGNRTVSR